MIVQALYKVLAELGGVTWEQMYKLTFHDYFTLCFLTPYLIKYHDAWNKLGESSSLKD